MIVLYRDGDTHEVKGVKCELKRFDNSELKAQLANGWRLTPERSASIDPVKQDSDIDELREKARVAGIDGWETKRFKTLRKELEIMREAGDDDAEG